MSAEFGADDHVRGADLLPAALHFLDGRSRVGRQDRQRVRCAERCRVGVGLVMDSATVSHNDRDVQRDRDVANGAEVSRNLCTSSRRSSGDITNVTMSATSAASARALGPRTAITTSVCLSGPSYSRSKATASWMRVTR